MRRAVLAALAAALLFPAAAGAVATPAFHDGEGAHVTRVQRLGDRLFEVTLATPLLTAPTNVRILLPDDYDTQPRRRFPALWLFHGTSGGAQDWTAQPGRAQDITAGLPLIVVMPDAGVRSDGGGWFTDWVNGGRFGPPKWETWHIAHLVPWIDAQLRTVATRAGRAIAGLSQGGFGAMSYASRHPDMFQAAASFSGAIDIAANPEVAVPIITPIVTATEVGLDGVPPFTFFGDRVSNEINWAAHDPATLAGNLRGMRLYTYSGDGTPGPLEHGDYNPGAAIIEAGAHQLTQLFVRELRERNIPVDDHDYGGGTHIWPYWERDLRDLTAPLMRDFADPDPAPARIDYTSADAHWSQWGWSVATDRPAREFSRLQDAGPRGFALSGSGRATVTTPAVYRPGAAATITRTGATVRDTVTTTVGDDGRLRVTVPLGPGNAAQQHTAGAVTRVFTTRVEIRAPARPSAARCHRTRRTTSGRRRAAARVVRRTAHLC